MTGDGNWTYFLNGRHPTLIDAGTGQPAHLDAIAAVRAEGPGHVLVTHAHSDHASGAAAIDARWPGTTFSKHIWPERDVRFDVSWSHLNDGDVVPAGDDALQVVHTPGHSPDHIAFWHAGSKTLFSGDLVVQGSTVVIPATAGGSVSDYLRSLHRVLALAPVRLLPAHGRPIEEPEIILRRYIEHRHQREAQILLALEAGRSTVDAIVARVYVDLAPALVPMARESVLAHLIKLEHDGLARRSGEEWKVVS